MMPTRMACCSPPDGLFRLLGWIGIGLGVLEILAPKAVTKSIGAQGNEGLVRAYGVHELGTGLLLVSGETPVGFWSRLAGDGLNAALLVGALRRDNPKRGVAGLALTVLAGLTILDLAHAGAAKGPAGETRRPGNGGQSQTVTPDPVPLS